MLNLIKGLTLLFFVAVSHQEEGSSIPPPKERAAEPKYLSSKCFRCDGCNKVGDNVRDEAKSCSAFGKPSYYGNYDNNVDNIPNPEGDINLYDPIPDGTVLKCVTQVTTRLYKGSFGDERTRRGCVIANKKQTGCTIQVEKDPYGSPPTIVKTCYCDQENCNNEIVGSDPPNLKCYQCINAGGNYDKCGTETSYGSDNNVVVCPIPNQRSVCYKNKTNRGCSSVSTFATLECDDKTQECYCNTDKCNGSNDRTFYWIWSLIGAVIIVFVSSISIN